MVRIVREGTPAKFYRLTRRDLPRDNDLRNSYLRYVDLSGLDLTGQDWRDADIIDCKAENVILPDFEVDGMQATDYMQSRRTDWQGSKIPAGTNIWQYDFIEEILNQQLDANPADTVIEFLRDTVRSQKYDICWESAVFKLMKTGIRFDQLAALSERVWAGYPTLLNWALRSNDPSRVRETVLPSSRFDPEALPWNVDGANTVIENVKELLVGKYDRYALRMEVRQVLRDKYSSWTNRAQHFDVWFAQLDPYPRIFFRDATIAPEVKGDDWFMGGWPA